MEQIITLNNIIKLLNNISKDNLIKLNIKINNETNVKRIHFYDDKTLWWDTLLPEWEYKGIYLWGWEDYFILQITNIWWIKLKLWNYLLKDNNLEITSIELIKYTELEKFKELINK